MRPDGLFLVALAALLGAGAATSPAATLAGALAAAVVLLLRLRLALVLVPVMGLAFAAGAWRAREALGAFQAAHGEVSGMLAKGAPCAGTGLVVASPVRFDDRESLVLETDALTCAGRPMGERALRLSAPPEGRRRGDRVAFEGRLRSVELLTNADLPSPWPRAALAGLVLTGRVEQTALLSAGAGLRAAVDGARQAARERILAGYAEPAASLARALVLGENDLDPEDRYAFQRSGLAHLLAVSGTHLVVAVVLVVSALRWLLVRITPLSRRCDVSRFSSLLGALAALLYADFSGGSGSAWRAAWMLAVVFGARALSRRTTPLRAVGASILVGWALEPLLLFDLSFLLSVAATAGLLFASGSVSRRLERAVTSAPLRFLLSSLVATGAAQLACTPLLALLGPGTTLAGSLANVVAGPVGELFALPLALVHPLVAELPGLGRGVALAASGALLAVRALAHGAAAVTWAQVPVPPPSAWHFAVLAVGALSVWLTPGGTRFWRFSTRKLGLLALAGALAAVELATLRAAQPLGRLRVTFVDVGQGDAALVDLPNGAALLIDGGADQPDMGARVLLPLLRARRRRALDALVMTHPDRDHLGGLPSVAREVPAGALWSPGGAAEESSPLFRALAESVTASGGRRVTADALCGRSLSAGDARLEVLSPCPDPARAAGEADPLASASTNNRSLVLRVTLGRRSVLLVGDAELPAERALLAQREAGRAGGEPPDDERALGGLRSDVLKVGHHGSKTSSGRAFLAQVAPAAAVISLGAGNRHGHPSPSVAARLAATGALVARTDEAGSVTWETDGERMWLSTAR